MIQIASDRVNRPLYRAIVKTIADIAAWLNKHTLSIFLIDLCIQSWSSISFFSSYRNQKRINSLQSSGISRLLICLGPDTTFLYK